MILGLIVIATMAACDSAGTSKVATSDTTAKKMDSTHIVVKCDSLVRKDSVKRK